MTSFTRTKEGAPIGIGRKHIATENPVNGGAIVFELKRHTSATKTLRPAA